LAATDGQGKYRNQMRNDPISEYSIVMKQAWRLNIEIKIVQASKLEATPRHEQK